MFIDRDFRSDDDIQSIEKKCSDNYIILKCWSKKEIENFLVIPEAILRIINKRAPNITQNQVDDLIIEAENNLIEDTLGAIADRWMSMNKGRMASDAMKAANNIFNEFRNTRGIRNTVSGKRLIGEISQLSKERWKVSFGAMTLCRAIKLEEFDPEITDAIKQLTT